ncbi:DUF7507 domain-containing protein [Paenibacillus pasadenensis]|uniref:DUF7507 domain-containing protein n=1 Tax=Paenibacillus TaxID=44249 RepID=UPI00041D3BED|nr:glycine-rich protein [Paenibacillus pasadenensis]
MTAIGEQFVFNFTGAQQTWNVPGDVGVIRIECWGAQGGTATTQGIGGNGGYAAGTFRVTPGEPLVVAVGGKGEDGRLNGPATAGGFNGGGNGGPGFDNSASGGGGGGASDVRQGGSTLANRILIGAGGGGGVGTLTSPTQGFRGAAGGGLQGASGTGDDTVAPGKGGTQTAGGAGGVGGSNSGTPGVLGQGGSGTGNRFEGGGGGGGGFYGGGASGAGNGNDGSAGGGSSFLGTAYDAETTAGVQAGDGRVVITALGLLTFDVVKTGDRNEASPGDTVQFSIVVTNTGNYPITNIAVNDPLIGISTTLPQLDPGQSEAVAGTYTIPAQAPPGVLTNTATVQPQDLAPKTASYDVLVSEAPSLLFTKSVDRAQASPGDTVIFTIRARNLGNVDFVNLTLTDPLLGLEQRINRIVAGEEFVLNWPYVIPPLTPPGFLTNLARIQGDNLSPQLVGVSLTILAAAQLSAVKTTTPNVARPGQTLTYVVTVTNFGNVELTNVRVVDSQTLLDETIPILRPGEAREVSTTYFVPLNTPPGVYMNTAFVTSDQTPSPLPAESSAEVIAVRAIGLVKSVSPAAAAPGQPVVFRIQVGNLGNVPLGPVRLVDRLTGLDETIPSLAVDEIVEVEAPYVIPVGTPLGSRVLNLAEATAAGADPAEASTLVDIVAAGLAIAKSGDRTVAAPGDVIAYTLTVVNTTSLTQTNVLLSDPAASFAETVPSLAPGASVIRTVGITVPAGAANGSVIDNVLTVSSDQTPAQLAAYQTVVQTDPPQQTTLAIRKLSDRLVAGPGEPILFTAEVTNTGPSPATSIVVADSLAGYSQAIPALAPGQTAVTSFIYTVPPGTRQGTVLVNTVTATAPEVPAQLQPVTDSLSVLVALPDFLLELTSRAAPNPVPYRGSTLIEITVRNISSQTLTGVRVLESLTEFAAVIPVLPPGDSRTFTVPFTPPARTRGGTVFDSFATAFSNETALRQVLVPIVAAIRNDALLTESVSPQVAAPGGTVVFTVRIANTGNVPFVNGVLQLPLFGLRLTTESFEIGADQTLRLPYRIPDDAPEGLIVSEAIASSDNGPTLRATAAVRVVHEEE